MELCGEEYDEFSTCSSDEEQPHSTARASSHGGTRRARYTEEERRSRRRTANRESARRMRAKRTEAMTILQQNVTKLADHNHQLQIENRAILKRLQRIEAENKSLRVAAEGGGRAALPDCGTGARALSGGDPGHPGSCCITLAQCLPHLPASPACSPHHNSTLPIPCQHTANPLSASL